MSKITVGHEKKYEADATKVVLTFTENGTRNNALANSMAWRYRWNGLYDPDPSILSPDVSGFAEWAALYKSYRVHSARYRVSIVNKESNAITFGAFWSPLDLGINPARSVITSQLEQPYTRSKMVGISDSGVDLATVSGSMWGQKSYGSAEYNVDPSTRSLTTTVPTELFYLYIFAFVTEISLSFTTGIWVDVQLDMSTRFFFPNKLPQDSYLLRRLGDFEPKLKSDKEYEDLGIVPYRPVFELVSLTQLKAENEARVTLFRERIEELERALLLLSTSDKK
jgi:hypothetical protein